jgi:dUTP pyrophosphatase
MFLRIQPISDSVKVLYRNHQSFHEGDSGLDVFFAEDEVIEPHSTVLIDLQIRCEATLASDNTRNLSYYLYPRSSIYRTPLRMANSVGIIDAGYRGTLKVALDNIGDTEYNIEKGVRLFQICSPTLEPITMSLTDNLTETERGSGGFGSTHQS